MVGYYNSKIQLMTFSTVPVSVFSPVLGGEREAQDGWGAAGINMLQDSLPLAWLGRSKTSVHKNRKGVL